MDELVGEIRFFAFPFAPKGWAPCDGRLLPIMQNTALFSLLGTSYGGDGKSTFALPDLRGRTPRHAIPGSSGGTEVHYLSEREIPRHDHELRASAGIAVDRAPGGGLPATGPDEAYGYGAPVEMQAGRCSPVGAGQPHENRQPWIALNACIAVQGVFPQRQSLRPPSVGEEPYIGEVRFFVGDTPPAGWAFCDGRRLPVNPANAPLFYLIRNTYGGDGVNDFALPDLRGRVLVSAGTSRSGTTYALGETGGVELVTLTADELPTHVHPLLATEGHAVSDRPMGRPARTRSAVYVRDPAPPSAPLTSGEVGEGLPHDNMAPSVGISFIIALSGVFPSEG